MELRNSHILAHIENKTSDYENRVALGIKSTYGWEELTYKGLGLLSRKIARYLIEDIGIKKGESLAILSESKPEYGACVFASVLTGTITQHYLPTALELQKKIPEMKYVFVIDEHAHSNDVMNVYDSPDNYNAKWRQRSSKSTALIIYTSGTTGAPKGVEISFANINAQLVDMEEALVSILPKHNINILSILPMNHLFEMTVGFSAFLNKGESIYYTTSLKPKDYV